MKKNEIADLKSKTIDELTRMLMDLREEVGKIKKEELLKKTKNYNFAKSKKKDLARVVTFLSMKKAEIMPEALNSKSETSSNASSGKEKSS